MSRVTVIALSALALACSLGPGTQSAAAQVGLSAEVRAGATVPVGEFTDANQDTGLGIGAELGLHFNPTFATYLSFSRHAFGCKDSCALGDEPSSTGVGAGIRFAFPGPTDALLWTRAGVTGRRWSGGPVAGDTEWGFELGAGIDMLITRDIYVVPHVAYLSHDAPQGFRASYLSLGAGLHYRIR
jgi:hypothetical protein